MEIADTSESRSEGREEMVVEWLEGRETDQHRRIFVRLLGDSPLPLLKMKRERVEMEVLREEEELKRKRKKQKLTEEEKEILKLRRQEERVQREKEKMVRKAEEENRRREEKEEEKKLEDGLILDSLRSEGVFV